MQGYSFSPMGPRRAWGSFPMRRCLCHFAFAIAIVCLCSPDLSHARTKTTEPITVRGVLSRGGKAGDLWTLILDEPYPAHDPAQSKYRWKHGTPSIELCRPPAGSPGPELGRQTRGADRKTRHSIWT